MANHKCESKHNVAIIVPYRDRLPNLLVFLNNMHEFLAKQQITYGLFLVEPIKGLAFNRGLLMNIGYLEAIKDGMNNDLNIEWNCFIFHGLFFIWNLSQIIYFWLKKTFLRCWPNSQRWTNILWMRRWFSHSLFDGC